MVCNDIIRPILSLQGGLAVKENFIISSTPSFPPGGGHFLYKYIYPFAQYAFIDVLLVMKYLFSTGELEMKKI